MPRVSANERAATRRRLIDAGKGEFADRGLAGARFDEISVAAGHAKGTIYNYFPNKEVLFFTIIEDWCMLLVEAIGPAAGASAREQLLAIARLDTEIARKDPDLARVVVSQMPALAGTHHAAVAAAIEPGTALLADVISAGLASGELTSTHDSSTLARLFLATLSAFEHEALGPDPRIGLGDVTSLIDVHFLAGLCAP